MNRRTLTLLAAGTVLCWSSLGSLRAADSFFQRMSPFRHMRHDNAVVPATTHAQLQPATEGLNRRGIHSPIDPELRQQRQQAHINGGPLGERTEAGQPPTLEELRAHLLVRGIDPDRLDARFARMQEARANGLRKGRLNRRTASTTLSNLAKKLWRRE